MDIKIIPVKRILLSNFPFGRYLYMKAIVDYYYFIDGAGPLDIFGKPRQLCPDDSWKRKLRWILDGCFDLTKLR